MSDKPTLTVNTGPFKSVAVLGHASIEDFDREAGKVGAALEEADFSLIYRDTLPEIHSAVVEAIEKLSGISRNVNAEATAKLQARAKDGVTVAPVLENFVPYANRVKANVDAEVWATIDAKFREVALATPVSAAPSVRTGGGAPSKANQEKADGLLQLDPDTLETKIEKLMAAAPAFNLARDEDGKPERVSLARLIGAWLAAQEI
jgi:hypothetical protein